MKIARWTVLLATITFTAFGVVSAADEFKTHAARAAADTYTATVAKLNQDYQLKMDIARKAYVTQLAAAKDTATKAGNLDEAIHIRDTMEKLKAEANASAPAPKPGPADERQKLAQALGGTTWQSGSKPLKFNPDGTAIFGDEPGWQWAPIDGRQVILFRPSDGWTNRLSFDDSMAGFSFQEFGDGTRRNAEAGKAVGK